MAHALPLIVARQVLAHIANERAITGHVTSRCAILPVEIWTVSWLSLSDHQSTNNSAPFIKCMLCSIIRLRFCWGSVPDLRLSTILLASAPCHSFKKSWILHPVHTSYAPSYFLHLLLVCTRKLLFRNACLPQALVFSLSSCSMRQHIPNVYSALYMFSMLLQDWINKWELRWCCNPNTTQNGKNSLL